MEKPEYLKKHLDYLSSNAAECALFLKRNDAFPLDEPCDLVLVGNGARNTVKGGTGSGDLDTPFFVTIEQGLINKGFNIVSTDWMDQYDSFKQSTKKDYIKDLKKQAKKAKMMAAVYSLGFFEEEKNHGIACDYEGDACIYVLARHSGEGNDRRLIKGDVLLTDQEVNDILKLNERFKKFMLVLNVSGVIDLSPVLGVSNILLLSQLGTVTGDVFADILLGIQNPSGKLTTTWTKVEDYPCFNEFGDLHDTFYKEGIYVGYKYFTSENISVHFPFGFGLSYTDFEITPQKINVDHMTIMVETLVRNIGKQPGKEVVQAYLSNPNTVLDQPKIELCGYQKTKNLLPNEEEIIQIKINLLEFASYDERSASMILPQGDYIIRIGHSSIHHKPILKAHLDKTVILEKLENKLKNPSIKTIDVKQDLETILDIPTFKLDDSKVETKIITYKKHEYIDPMIEKLPPKELALMCLGHHEKGFIASMIGSSSKDVIGGAGQTVLALNKITRSLTMADGPAGIRLRSEYGIDEKGNTYTTKLDPIFSKMLDVLPKFIHPFIKPKKKRNGKIVYQHTTALPIATAIAQSFNDNFVYTCGNIVKQEMEIFNVDLWLAPALNLHRHILCGRNFEYYSEDPFLSGMMAIAMTKGVEEHSLKGVTLKHFACNNQEWNRTNNNSQLSERALRETYLKGFKMCIKSANPKAIMTSYNLINGIHTSESYEPINDILRCEWGYEGLVMSDWVQTGRRFSKLSKYPSIHASNHILAGNDLTMPGSTKDFKDIMKAYKRGKIKKEDLIYSASRIYRSIMKQKNV